MEIEFGGGHTTFSTETNAVKLFQKINILVMFTIELLSNHCFT